MTKISNDKSKYIKRGVTAPKREIEKNKERDFKIGIDWHIGISPDVSERTENERT